MKTKNNLIATFKTHQDAESAVKQLEADGFSMKNISVVSKGYQTEEHPIGYYNTGDRVKFWGKEGAFWGSLWGILFGSAFFWIPGIGPLAIAGPIASTIVGGVEGAIVGGGLSALGGALASIGIPKDSIVKYEEVIKEDHVLLIVNGTAEEVEEANTLLSKTDADLNIHLA